MTVRTKSRNICFGLVLLGAVANCDVIGTGVVLDRSDGGLRKIVEVGDNLLNIAGIEQAYKRLVSEHERAALKYLAISAFANSDDASQYLVGKGHTDMAYDEAIQRLFEAQRRGPLRMLRLVSMGGNTVVQKTDGRTVSRTVVRGTDPTLFEAGGVRCELLEVYFNRLPRPIRADGQNPVLLHVYLKTSALPTIQAAEEVTRVIQHMLGHRNVFLNMRTDTWFIEDERFPLWYPFDTDRRPPTFAQYKSRGEAFCIADESKIRCQSDK